MDLYHGSESFGISPDFLLTEYLCYFCQFAHRLYSAMMTHMDKKSWQSLFKGSARLVDLFGTLDRNKLSTIRNNMGTVKQDWEQVGKDISEATGEYVRTERQSA